MSLIRKHGAVLQAWACLALVMLALFKAINREAEPSVAWVCFTLGDAGIDLLLRLIHRWSLLNLDPMLHLPGYVFPSPYKYHRDCTYNQL